MPQPFAGNPAISTLAPPFGVVTGASAGIGREIVLQLVTNHGWTILATARRLDRLQQLASELPPGRLLIEAGDLADPAFRDQLWRRVESIPAPLDLLVNNAGVGHYAPFDRQDPATFTRIIELNVVALMDLTHRALGPMKARRAGQIVQVSSTLGFLPLPYSSAYVASKHAVNGLTRSLRTELRGSGVRVWAACPNRTESEFHGAALGVDLSAGGPPAPYAEPTARVARGIVRAIQRPTRHAFVFPTWRAWLAAASGRIPGLYDLALRVWLEPMLRREAESAGETPALQPRESR